MKATIRHRNPPDIRHRRRRCIELRCYSGLVSSATGDVLDLLTLTRAQPQAAAVACGVAAPPRCGIYAKAQSSGRATVAYTKLELAYLEEIRRRLGELRAFINPLDLTESTDVRELARLRAIQGNMAPRKCAPPTRPGTRAHGASNTVRRLNRGDHLVISVA